VLGGDTFGASESNTSIAQTVIARVVDGDTSTVVSMGLLDHEQALHFYGTIPHNCGLTMSWRSSMTMAVRSGRNFAEGALNTIDSRWSKLRYLYPGEAPQATYWFSRVLETDRWSCNWSGIVIASFCISTLRLQWRHPTGACSQLWFGHEQGRRKMTGSDKYKGVGVVALLSVADSTILRYIIINKPFRSIAWWWWQNSC